MQLGAGFEQVFFYTESRESGLLGLHSGALCDFACKAEFPAVLGSPATESHIFPLNTPHCDQIDPVVDFSGAKEHGWFHFRVQFTRGIACTSAIRSFFLLH